MKKSEKTKPSKGLDQSGVDRISDLPDAILQLILSSLPPTEELVRTSILSTRWRYLWTSIPAIDIDCSRGPKKFKKNNFKEFVYWVLLNKTCDLDSFRLSCSDHYNRSTIGRWIHASVLRKVKSLDLTFCFKNQDKAIELPHYLVTCDTLKVLSLFLMRQPLRLPKPNYTCFPALRVLKLDNVELFDFKLVEAFFENCCPLLEELSLIDCLIRKTLGLRISSPNLKTLILDNQKMTSYDDIELLYGHPGSCGSLEICCPKLVYIVYAGHITYFFKFENLDSLKTAVIHPIHPTEEEMQEPCTLELMGYGMCELITGISHVEDLSLSSYFIKAIVAVRDRDGNFAASFPNLKLLEIRTNIDALTLNLIIQILRSSPILESFSLIIQEVIAWPEHWELDQVREIMTRHLKKIEFYEFNGEERTLAAACFLLEHGNVLEEMVFSWRNEAEYNEKSLETIKQVSEYHKAFSTIKLTTLVRDQ